MRLQVEIVPQLGTVKGLQAHKVPPSRFLHIGKAETTLEDLCLDICSRYSKLYPLKPSLDIKKITDGESNDLDLTFTIGDVFDDKGQNPQNSLVRVIQAPSGNRLNSVPVGSLLRPKASLAGRLANIGTSRKRLLELEGIAEEKENVSPRPRGQHSPPQVQRKRRRIEEVIYVDPDQPVRSVEDAPVPEADDIEEQLNIEQDDPAPSVPIVEDDLPTISMPDADDQIPQDRSQEDQPADPSLSMPTPSTLESGPAQNGPSPESPSCRPRRSNRLVPVVQSRPYSLVSSVAKQPQSQRKLDKERWMERQEEKELQTLDPSRRASRKGQDLEQIRSEMTERSPKKSRRSGMTSTFDLVPIECEGKIWTEEQIILLHACKGKGMTYDRISRDYLIGRSASACQKQLAFTLKDFTDGSYAHPSHHRINSPLIRSKISTSPIFTRLSKSSNAKGTSTEVGQFGRLVSGEASTVRIQDVDSEAEVAPVRPSEVSKAKKPRSRRQNWEIEDIKKLVKAHNEGVSVKEIQRMLFPGRTLDAVKSKKAEIFRQSGRIKQEKLLGAGKLADSSGDSTPSLSQDESMMRARTIPSDDEDEDHLTRYESRELNLNDANKRLSSGHVRMSHVQVNSSGDNSAGERQVKQTDKPNGNKRAASRQKSKPWTEEEDDLVSKGRGEGLTITEINEKYLPWRTNDSVRHRVHTVMKNGTEERWKHTSRAEAAIQAELDELHPSANENGDGDDEEEDSDLANGYADLECSPQREPSGLQAPVEDEELGMDATTMDDHHLANGLYPRMHSDPPEVEQPSVIDMFNDTWKKPSPKEYRRRAARQAKVQVKDSQEVPGDGLPPTSQGPKGLDVDTTQDSQPFENLRQPQPFTQPSSHAAVGKLRPKFGKEVRPHESASQFTQNTSQAQEINDTSMDEPQDFVDAHDNQADESDSAKDDQHSDRSGSAEGDVVLGKRKAKENAPQTPRSVSPIEMQSPSKKLNQGSKPDEEPASPDADIEGLVRDRFGDEAIGEPSDVLSEHANSDEKKQRRILKGRGKAAEDGIVPSIEQTSKKDREQQLQNLETRFRRSAARRSQVSQASTGGKAALGSNDREASSELVVISSEEKSASRSPEPEQKDSNPPSGETSEVSTTESESGSDSASDKADSEVEDKPTSKSPPNEVPSSPPPAQPTKTKSSLPTALIQTIRRSAQPERPPLAPLAGPRLSQSSSLKLSDRAMQASKPVSQKPEAKKPNGLLSGFLKDDNADDDESDSSSYSSSGSSSESSIESAKEPLKPATQKSGTEGAAKAKSGGKEVSATAPAVGKGEKRKAASGFKSATRVEDSGDEEDDLPAEKRAKNLKSVTKKGEVKKKTNGLFGLLGSQRR